MREDEYEPDPPRALSHRDYQAFFVDWLTDMANEGVRFLTVWALAAVVTALVVLRLVVGLRDAREGRFTPTVLTPGKMPR